MKTSHGCWVTAQQGKKQRVFNIVFDIFEYARRSRG